MIPRYKAFSRFGGKPKVIPQSMLVVRGARYHKETIIELLTSEVPQAPYNPSPPVGAQEAALWGDFTARLEPINSEYDANAIQVMVNGKRVGYIGRELAKDLRPLLGEQTPEFDCTIFWNGDPQADYQFYTVQLFS